MLYPRAPNLILMLSMQDLKSTFTCGITNFQIEHQRSINFKEQTKEESFLKHASMPSIKIL